MKIDPRLERILLMEDRYDKVSRVLTVLEEAVSEYEKCRDELDILDGYMSSGQWKEDFEADEAGLIPVGVTRKPHWSASGGVICFFADYS